MQPVAERRKGAWLLLVLALISLALGLITLLMAAFEWFLLFAGATAVLFFLWRRSRRRRA